jgi:subtilisin-like proprotein convertase family protein
VPTIAGTFTPNNPLSVFDGQSLAGTWRMTVQDFAGGDTGTLVEWCLAPAEGLSSAIFSDGFESGDSSAWSATVP